MRTRCTSSPVEVHLDAIEVNLDTIEVNLDAVEVNLDTIEVNLDADEVHLVASRGSHGRQLDVVIDPLRAHFQAEKLREAVETK